MERVLEPEVMESRGDAFTFNELAEKRQVYARNFLKKYLTLCKGSYIVDVGSGPATLAVYAASLNVSYRIDCVELSDEMNNMALENIKQKSLEDRVKIIKTDAKKMEIPENRYDIAFCHNVLHQIPEPAHVINEMVRVTKTEGCILIRDILRPDSQEELSRIIMEREEETGPIARKSEKMTRESALAALTFEEVKALLDSSRFGRYELIREENYKGYLPHFIAIKI